MIRLTHRLGNNFELTFRLLQEQPSCDQGNFLATSQCISKPEFKAQCQSIFFCAIHNITRKGCFNQSYHMSQYNLPILVFHVSAAILDFSGLDRGSKVIWERTQKSHNLVRKFVFHIHLAVAIRLNNSDHLLL